MKPAIQPPRIHRETSAEQAQSTPCHRLRDHQRSDRWAPLLAAALALAWLVGGLPAARAQACAPGLSANLLAWWPGDGHPYEVVEPIDTVLLENAATYAPGQVGQAFSFGSAYQRALILESDNTDLSRFSRWTIEAWVRPTSFDNATSPTIYAEGDRVISLGLNYSTGYLESWINGTARLIGTVPLTLNEWNHVALAYDGGNRRLYVNGLAAGTGTGPRPVPDPYGDAAIGNVPLDDPTTAFAGDIDEVSLYDRALNAAELAAIASAGSAGKCFPGGPAPVFVVQPASQTRYVGGEAEFTAVAMGTPRPTYQWLFRRTGQPTFANLPAENGYTLRLTNLMFEQDGEYVLQATSTAGTTTSAVARLTVKFCADIPDGLVVWWPGDGSALDVTGNHPGAVWGGVSYLSGVVTNGLAFGFNGTDAYVAVPDSPDLSSHEGPNGELSVETWIYVPQYPAAERVVLAKGDPGRWEYILYLSSKGTPSFYVYAPSASTNIAASGGTIALNGWHHLVGVLKQGEFISLYIDGDLKDTRSNAAVASAHGPTPLYLGCASTGYFFNGGLDEVAIYRRALASNEIADLYALGSVGKCAGADSPAPTFVVQPADKHGYLANSATLEGLALGTPRPQYQWFHNGSPVEGETNATLTLSDLEMSDAGSYTILATNRYGVTNSRTATLTLIDITDKNWDFENGWDGWTTDNYALWEIGFPKGGPGAPHAGNSCVGTVLDGNYPYGVSSRLVSPIMDLPAVAVNEELVLSLWHWFSYGSGYWYEGWGCQSGWGGNDYGSVQVQVFNPNTAQWSDWVTLLTVRRGSSVWSPTQANLTIYAGSRIRLGFLHVDANEDWDAWCGLSHYESSGWYIDDIRIEKRPELLFTGSESFEGGWNGWYTTGGIWQVGPVSSAPAGTNCAGTVLGGNYPWLASSRLVSPKIDVPAVEPAEEVVLEFWHWFSYWSGYWYEGWGCQSGWGGNDYGTVQVQAFDPDTARWSDWTSLLTVSRQSVVWSPVQVDLTGYAGKRVRLGFLHADNNEDWDPWCGMQHYESSGWYIDDIRIEKRPELLFSGAENFEGGWNGWYTTGGIWQVGPVSSAPAGANCAGTVLGGTYPWLGSSRLVSPKIDVPAVEPAEEVVLKFWHWFSYWSGYWNEGWGCQSGWGGNDYGTVQVQGFDPDTARWSDWASLLTVSRQSAVWSPVQVDLTGYAGKRVRVGFLHADNNEDWDPWCGMQHYESSGWYIDDVQIEKRMVPTLSGPEFFETGWSAWYADQGVWQVGVPTAGPAVAHSGAICAGTVLAGSYPILVSSRLVSPTINLPVVAEGEPLTLAFWQWLSYGASDYAYVQIRTNDQTTGSWSSWSTVATEPQSGTAWTRSSVSLSDYAGQRVQFAFYHTDNNESGSGDSVAAGWYLDDVFVKRGNLAIDPISDRTTNETSNLSFRVTVSGTVPGSRLSFSLIDPPAGSRIDPRTGDFSWSPSECQGPGTYRIPIYVVDRGNNIANDLAVAQITVKEANQPPWLMPRSVTAYVDRTNFFSLCSGDADCPANPLAYSLIGTVPSGASIDSSTGAIRWVPTAAQVGSHTLTVQLCDGGTPDYCVTNTVKIGVTAFAPCYFGVQALRNGDLAFTIQDGRTDVDYLLEAAASLCECPCQSGWMEVGRVSPTTMPYTFVYPRESLENAERLFFRLNQMPR